MLPGSSRLRPSRFAGKFDILPWRMLAVNKIRAKDATTDAPQAHAIHKWKDEDMNILKTVALVSVVAGTAACSSMPVPGDDGQDMTGQPGVYTLVNLHPDAIRNRLYAVNFQQDGLIPLCTEVTLVKAKRKALQFKVNATGTTYTYYYHKAAAEPFDQHLKHFFGKTCNKDAVARLSAVDREGIAAGKALPGMSKQGVVYAIGMPPRHVTPSMDANIWKYWSNRYNTFNVEFDGAGKVSRVVN